MKNPSRIGRDQAGFTLVELLVAITIGMIVVVGILAVVDATRRSSSATTARVVANQTARPALTRIMDGLHSSCVGPGAAPILAGSGDDAISFLHKTGSAVGPAPDKRTIALAGGTLTDTVYGQTSSPPRTAPPWTFATTPTSSFEVAKGIGRTSTSVPVFQYFAYETNGQLSTTRLSTPLIAADAARVVAVEVTLKATPTQTTPNPDAGAPVTLSDTALLRFAPAGGTAQENLPCL